MYQMKAIASLHNKTVHISIHQTTQQQNCQVSSLQILASGTCST